MNCISQLYFTCKFCDNYKCWEVIELCPRCSNVPQHDPCLTYCYSRAKNQHNEKCHSSVDLV